LKNATLTQHNDTFVTIKPLSEKISRYISYYYFHASEDENYNKSFVFYPNYKHALTVYKNSEVSLTTTSSTVTPSEQITIQPLYTVNKEKNLKVSIQGRFDKIGIVFNPLGINFFIDKPLSEILTSDFDFFPHFGEEFRKVLAQVFDEKDLQNKVTLLDTFFEKRFVEFDEPILKKSIKEIISTNGAIKVAELSEEVNTNRKTLLRLFKKHTNMSVEEYRKMVMFRQAFNYFHQNKEKTNLTDVALFSMYYDQAHFIKHFKSITKETPTTLLSKISHLGEEDTYWYFEN
jgi:AraC-like DNA-binding protein